MRKEIRRRSLCAGLLVAALALGAGGPAMARGASGKGVLEVKDSDAMTLFVDEMVIQVTDETRIYNEQERRISFAQIPEPAELQTTVEYSGSLAGRGLVARELIVRVIPK